MPGDPLHADAVAVLTGWAAPSPEQDRLRRDYLALLSAQPRAMRRDCVPAHLTGSALIVDPATGRVLLLLHGRANLWLQAGGHCEDGDDSLAATALREATEESGIAGLTLGAGGRPIALDRHPAPCRPGVAEWHLDVQYLALAPPGAVAEVSEESHDLGWFGDDDLPSPLGGGVDRLIAAARAAL